MNLNFDFENLIWGHLFLKASLRRKGSTSVWWKILNALSIPFSSLLTPILQYLFDSAYLSKSTGTALELHGDLYKTSKRADETETAYRLRINEHKRIIRNGGIKQSIKAIIYNNIGVVASIEDSTTYDNAFIIGESPIGIGKIYSDSYYYIHFNIYLPDLSTIIFNKDDLIRQIDEHSPSADYTIFEELNGQQVKWSE